jgi:glucose/arabinose dehydrogenase
LACTLEVIAEAGIACYPDTDQRGIPKGETVELIGGWGRSGGRPMGAPTDLKVGPDGAIYISEDRNGTVLRLGGQR